jgi:hypothetical protein
MNLRLIAGVLSAIAAVGSFAMANRSCSQLLPGENSRFPRHCVRIGGLFEESDAEISECSAVRAVAGLY